MIAYRFLPFETTQEGNLAEPDTGKLWKDVSIELIKEGFYIHSFQKMEHQNLTYFLYHKP